MSPPLKNIALVGVTSVSLNLIFLSARLPLLTFLNFPFRINHLINTGEFHNDGHTYYYYVTVLFY